MTTTPANTAVPEPATLLLMLMGTGLLALLRKRKAHYTERHVAASELHLFDVLRRKAAGRPISADRDVQFHFHHRELTIYI